MQRGNNGNPEKIFDSEDPNVTLSRVIKPSLMPYPMRTAMPMMARWKARLSTESAEVVCAPALGRLSTGYRPANSSADNSSIFLKLLICPFFAAQLMSPIPTTMAEMMPKVAEVRPKSSPSGHSSMENVSPSPAAVPCPPSKPTGMMTPKRSGMLNRRPKSRATKPRPTAYCPQTTI